jgi:hypothetical protein
MFHGWLLISSPFTPVKRNIYRSLFLMFLFSCSSCSSSKGSGKDSHSLSLV